ncbi:abc transporter permease protein domain [Lucifera butyrica]|uniref:Putative hemin transport system permease protein HrtB n=1 Tax=Lucifera butyrica TaxID=1351585 RepID=A0A498REL2_9FIRM|nr:ABC transporter permease [Lucifera butyrica]VBB08523.1 abc transporter permease protein domain [Lucifera butyrica]
MINLAVRDIRHSWWRYSLTGVILGLLIAATITLFGIYRGLIADALSLPLNSGADIWVVQDGTAGPYADASTLYDDEYRGLAGFPGVAEVSNVLYFSLQAKRGTEDIRIMVAGFEDGKMGQPTHMVAGRPIIQSRYEAIAEVRSGFKIGDKIRIRRHDYTVVGLVEKMVSASGDPVVYIRLKDAQEEQFKKDNTSIYNDRYRNNSNDENNEIADHRTNAVLIKVAPGWSADQVAANIKRWKHFQTYTYEQMKQLLLTKIIEKAAKQIGLFLGIFEVVSAAIVALLIYTMTMGKLKEIAVLKLIGASNGLITMMILREAWGIGMIGYTVGVIVSVLWLPIFPRYITYTADIRLITFALNMVMCSLASIISIRAAVKVEPASAIGG